MAIDSVPIDNPEKTPEEYKKDSELLRTIFDTLPIASLLISGSVIIDCNKEAISLLGGKDISEIIGKTIAAFSPERQTDGTNSNIEAQKKLEKALSGETQVFEWQQITIDKQPVDVEVYLNRIETGGKIYILATLRDLFMQRLLVGEISDKAAYFDSVINAVNTPVIAIDTSQRITLINKAGASFFNKKPEEVLGKRCDEFLQSDDCVGGNCATIEAMRSKTTKDAETIAHIGKKDIPISYMATPLIDTDGNVTGAVEFILDLTKQRNLMDNVVKIQKYMEGEITQLTKCYEIMETGDLTANYVLEKPDDQTKAVYEQLRILHNAINGTISSLRENIGDVNQKMNALTVSMDSASHSIDDVSNGVQQVAYSTEKVSQNTDKVLMSIDQISKAMQDMNAVVEEITAGTESVSNQSKETNELSLKGADLVKKTEIGMGEITESSDKVYRIVTDIEKQMGEISKIVVLIRDIANQTNLLALNAAIEAARAGDAGRGFAVVASEVKSLAQESRNSAERIEEMINNLKKDTQNASQAMGDAKGTIDEGSKRVSETLDAFTLIAESIEKVAKSASEVAAATEVQAATTEEISASIYEVASLIDQTVKEAADTAAATQESSAALNEISMMVTHVQKVAAEAMEANKKYTVA